MLRTFLIFTAALLVWAAPASATIPTGNLIVNPGAESGAGSSTEATVEPIPGWTTTSNFTVVQYAPAPGTPTSFPTTDVSTAIGGGTNFFTGGDDPSATMSQTVDVSGAASEIDGGSVAAALSADLGGFSTQEDAAVLTATFLNGSGSPLGTLTIGPVTAEDRSNATTLLPRSGSAAVPVGTRSITVLATATRQTGTSNDGYLDNIALTLAGTTAPAPAPSPSAKVDPTTAQVWCDYYVATADDTCTATVGDSTGSTNAPTGTVTFSSANGGVFVAGNTCALQALESEVGVTSCTVTFLPPANAQLEVSGTYGGDSSHAGSAASTAFLVAGPGSGAYQPHIHAFNPPTLSFNTQSPANNSTVSASATISSDLTDGAVCVSDDQSSATSATAAAFHGATVLAGRISKSKAITVHITKRHVHKGSVAFTVHFSSSKLAALFKGTTRAQIVVWITIKAPKGQALHLFQHELITLKLRHGRVIASLRRGPVVHVWGADDTCGGTFLVGIDASNPAIVTISWKTKALCPGGDQVELDQFLNSVYGAPLGPGVWSYDMSGGNASASFSFSGRVDLNTGVGTASGAITVRVAGPQGVATCTAPAPATVTKIK